MQAKTTPLSVELIKKSPYAYSTERQLDNTLLASSVQAMQKYTQIDSWLNKAMEEIQGMKPSLSPSKITERYISHIKNKGLAEILYDTRADVKIQLSRISMYLPSNWLQRLYKEIDILHDIDTWEEGDRPVTIDSFQTFIRWVLKTKPHKCPSFGLSDEGHLLTAWGSNDDSLILEFMPKDTILWIIR